MATAIDLSNANGKNVILVNPDTNVADIVVDASKIVSQVGNQDIDGVKKFTSSPIVPTPTAGDQVANKAYADLKVALASFTGANVSFAGNGYQKLPSGLIIQWGFASTNASGSATVGFPITFPNNMLSLTTGSNVTNSEYHTFQLQSKSGFYLQSWGSSGVMVPSKAAVYIAIGY